MLVVWWSSGKYSKICENITLKYWVKILSKNYSNGHLHNGENYYKKNTILQFIYKNLGDSGIKISQIDR